MSLEQKIARKEELKKQINDIFEKLKPLQNEYSQLYDDVINAEYQALKPLTPEKILSNQYTMFERNTGASDLQDFLNGFKNISISGYNPDSGLKVLSIQLNQNYDLEPQKDEINQFVPYVIPQYISQYFRFSRDEKTIKEDQKYKLIHVSEYSLSAGASYRLIIDADDNSYFVSTSYGSSRLLKQAPLQDMLKFIYDTYPYELKKG